MQNPNDWPDKLQRLFQESAVLQANLERAVKLMHRDPDKGARLFADTIGKWNTCFADVVHTTSEITSAVHSMTEMLKLESRMYSELASKAREAGIILTPEMNFADFLSKRVEG